MPAQALITHMTKAEVQKKITEMKAAELIKITEIDGELVVVCEMDGLRHKAGAPQALQKLADEDSARVRAEVAKLEAAEAAKAKPTPAPPADDDEDDDEDDA